MMIQKIRHVSNRVWTQVARMTDQVHRPGGSAGGLLMGAVVNLRPELVVAEVSSVPFVDLLNTMLDEDVPLTVG